MLPFPENKREIAISFILKNLKEVVPSIEVICNRPDSGKQSHSCKYDKKDLYDCFKIQQVMVLMIY